MSHREPCLCDKCIAESQIAYLAAIIKDADRLTAEAKQKAFDKAAKKARLLRLQGKKG